MTPWQQRWVDRLTAKARRQHKKKPREVTMTVNVDNVLARASEAVMIQRYDPGESLPPQFPIEHAPSDGPSHSMWDIRRLPDGSIDVRAWPCAICGPRRVPLPLREVKQQGRLAAEHGQVIRALMEEEKL